MRNDSRGWPTGAPVSPRTAGEHATTAILAALPVDEWTVFDGVRITGRRTPLQVVVGPQGVFVVESRRRPRVSARDELRPGGVRQDVVVQASSAAAAVSALTGLVEPRDVTPVVCFLGRELAPVMAGDVVICSSRNLLAILTGGAPLLDADRRRLVALDLDTSIGARPRTTRRRQTAAPRRRWLRSSLLGALLVCVASVGLWQVAEAASGAEPTGAQTSVVR